jgi:hypothetical protein
MRLKRFRSLERVRKNKSLGSLRADIRIAACLLNETLVPFEYEPRIESYVAATIKKRLNLENRLAKQVDERGLDRKRKVSETKDAATFNEFPSLTEEDLQDLTLGTYQLKQGIAYSVEHITAKNRFEIEKYKLDDMSGLIRAKLQSKHINRSQYSAYVQYEPNGEGTQAVKGYTCRCENGLRTVGMCSHLTGLIWYLSQGKQSVTYK